MKNAKHAAPLDGFKVVEFTAKGPVPFCTMLLSDMGAEVVQIARPAAGRKLDPSLRFTDRGKQELIIDLKSEEGLALAKTLIKQSDVLVEGYRPGAMERIGLGPDDCHKYNPSLIYTRITGWGQEGSLSHKAGHDINFLSYTGALDAIGTHNSGPVPPLNLIADFAGGSMNAALGICAALIARSRTGEGQIIDASMLDGVLSLMTPILAIRARGDWVDSRESNFLDGAAPYYTTYRTKDGRYLAVGAIEPKFRHDFIKGLGLPQEISEQCSEKSQWKRLKILIASMVEGKTLQEWLDIFEDIDACVTPVLNISELATQDVIIERSDTISEPYFQAGPTPRLSRTPLQKRPPVITGDEAINNILSRLGYSEEEIISFKSKNFAA